MFNRDAKVYKLIPAVQILNEEFTVGHVVECTQGGVKVSEYFNSESKAAILEKIKQTNGFKTKASKIIDALLGEEE